MCGRFAFYSPHEAVVRLFGVADDAPGDRAALQHRARRRSSRRCACCAGSESRDAATRDAVLGTRAVLGEGQSIGARMNNARARDAAREARRSATPTGSVAASCWPTGTTNGSARPRDKQPYFIQPGERRAVRAWRALWETWRDPANGRGARVVHARSRRRPPSRSRTSTTACRSSCPPGAYAEWLDPRQPRRRTARSAAGGRTRRCR